MHWTRLASALLTLGALAAPLSAQQELFKLTAGDGASADSFGKSVAIDGVLGIMGAPGDRACGSCPAVDKGSVYVFDVATGMELYKVSALQAGASGGGFGHDVALDGSFAIVGAPFEDGVGTSSGAAYVLDSATGAVLFRLTAADETAGAQFGWSVAVEGTLAIVGTTSNQQSSRRGAVYVFDLTSGLQLRRIRRDASEWDQGFGSDLAISGTRGLVGSNTTLRSWVYNLISGAELVELQAQELASFGGSGDIDGNLAILGARRNDDACPTEMFCDSGAAFVFDVNSGQQLFKLNACDMAGGDRFGRSVAISGTLALVGAQNETPGTSGYMTAAGYVYDLTTGQQVAQLIDSDGVSQDGFGREFALSGTLAIGGAETSNGLQNVSGAAFVFDVNIQNPANCGNNVPVQGIAETTKFLASDGADQDEGGRAMAIHGSVGLMGAPLHDDGCTGPADCRSGTAYLFDTLGGQELFKLTPDDAGTVTFIGSTAGESVALTESRALLGASGSTDAGIGSGAVYVFDTGNGQQLFKLLALDAAAGDWFGASLDAEGNRAIIGAPSKDAGNTLSGAAYIFDTLTGQQLLRLTPNDPGFLDEFGRCVAISGDRAIVGSRGGHPLGLLSGSVYIFDANTGVQLFKITGGDEGPFDRFGTSVSLDGNMAVIGSPYAGIAGAETGAAYVFDVFTGQQLFKLTATDGSIGDVFGGSVSVQGMHAVVGAFADDTGGELTGSAYYFDLSNGQELAKLNASDLADFDRFGFSVALDRGRVLVGAPQNASSGPSNGAAYVYDLRMPLGANYCSSAVNSTGSASAISATGSASLSDADLELQATAAPSGTPALFFFGPNVANQPLGQGTLCVGGTLTRLQTPVFELGGSYLKQLDFNTHGPALAGMGTVHFQCWYRDPAGGGSGFNLSDGMTIAFLP